MSAITMTPFVFSFPPTTTSWADMVEEELDSVFPVPAATTTDITAATAPTTSWADMVEEELEEEELEADEPDNTTTTAFIPVVPVPEPKRSYDIRSYSERVYYTRLYDDDDQPPAVNDNGRLQAQRPRVLALRSPSPLRRVMLADVEAGEVDAEEGEAEAEAEDEASPPPSPTFSSISAVDTATSWSDVDEMDEDEFFGGLIGGLARGEGKPAAAGSTTHVGTSEAEEEEGEKGEGNPAASGSTTHVGTLERTDEGEEGEGNPAAPGSTTHVGTLERTDEGEEQGENNGECSEGDPPWEALRCLARLLLFGAVAALAF